MSHRLLVVGPPRSGTTWVEHVLEATPGVRVVHEPDNELIDSFALKAKAGLGRYPALGATDDAPQYERLWEAAFAAGGRSASLANLASLALLRKAPIALIDDCVDGVGGRQARAFARINSAAAAPRRRGTAKPIQVVKSVHSGFALPFIAARFPAQTLVVLRNPLNAIASWKELGFTPRHFDRKPEVVKRIIEPLGISPPSSSDPLTDLAFSYMLLTTAIRRAASSLPECVIVEHEELCAYPVTRFRDLFQKIGVPWTAAAEQFIASSDRAGNAYKTTRVASEQADRWRRRLRPDEASTIAAVVDSFARIGSL